MMPNKQQIEQPKDEMKQARLETLNNLISEQVIHALGTPIDLRNVQVRRVWDDHYRVNVFVGINAGSVRVANSFLVVSDSDGRLIGSTPKITKQY
jgi:hypothetical protein